MRLAASGATYPGGCRPSFARYWDTRGQGFRCLLAVDPLDRHRAQQVDDLVEDGRRPQRTREQQSATAVPIEQDEIGGSPALTRRTSRSRHPRRRRSSLIRHGTELIVRGLTCCAALVDVPASAREGDGRLFGPCQRQATGEAVVQPCVSRAPGRASVVMLDPRHVFAGLALAMATRTGRGHRSSFAGGHLASLVLPCPPVRSSGRRFAALGRLRVRTNGLGIGRPVVPAPDVLPS